MKIMVNLSKDCQSPGRWSFVLISYELLSECFIRICDERSDSFRNVRIHFLLTLSIATPVEFKIRFLINISHPLFVKYVYSARE